jgi:hypothetical protein
VQRLELIVRQRPANDGRELRWRIADPFDPLLKPRSELVPVRRRYEAGLRHRCIARTNDYLAVANPAGIAVLVRRPADQYPLELTNKSRRKRSLFDPVETLLRCNDVVQDLMDLERKLIAILEVGLKDVFKGRERALQRARALRLPPQSRPA